MSPIERKKSFHLLLSNEELERLQKLADNAEVKQSDYIRGLIRREWNELMGDDSTYKKKIAPHMDPKKRKK